ncbi:MAG: sulfotransferase [Gemmatimonadetes bacterium]|nr:sulfotransferase [Gemmatimonadota bacterium]
MSDPAYDPTFHDPDVGVCFIHGILRRSGTNYLFRLLQAHPETSGPGPIWEDYLLHHSGPIRDFVDSTYDRWKEHWGVDEKVGPKSELQRYLGNSLRAFLKRQLTESTGSKGRPPEGQRETKILLTKTPTVQGIGGFFDLFPEDYLIVLVRDGRAVVESGVRSFGWKYESAIRSWAKGAQEILRVSSEFQQKHTRFLLVRYEDVYMDERGYLEKISSFLGLDPTLCRYDRLDRIRVLGSSDLMNTDGVIHWKGVKRTRDFDPISRFSSWDRKKHALFNRIAGGYMEQLGYELV